MAWKIISSIPIPSVSQLFGEGGIRTRVEGNCIIQEKWIPEDEDITRLFTPVLVKSKSTLGYYVALEKAGKRHYVLGLGTGLRCQTVSGSEQDGTQITMEKAPNASVSFNIKRKVRKNC